MKHMGRDRMRKLYGLTEPTQPADPEVLARRKYHETATKWLARWGYPLQAVFALIGFVVVMLPMFSKTWRAVIENTPVVARAFHDFSTLSGWAIGLFFVLMVLWGILNWRVKDYPGGWHPTKQWGFPTARQIVEMEIYPRTKREEQVFWCDFFFGTLMVAWWLLVCGLVAFFLRVEG